MKLFLVQHGDAVIQEVDPQRPLSEQGKRDVETMARWLHQASVRADHVLHSGKRRAHQTAEMLAQVMTTGGSCSSLSGMAPNDPVEAVAATVAALSQDTVLVGHLPFMSRLASLLIGADPERGIVAFQPGSIVCLEKDRSGRFSVNWMLRPDVLPKGPDASHEDR
ncbi:MAG: phosphohistidine phosphatase SixA [Gammaproteobacteria bacterium]